MPLTPALREQYEKAEVACRDGRITNSLAMRAVWEANKMRAPADFVVGYPGAARLLRECIEKGEPLK